MSTDVVGLWLNDIPEAVLNDDSSLRELSDVILQGYRAQKMVVADSALLITMGENDKLPHKVIGRVAQDLKTFLTEKRVTAEEIDAITISSYNDPERWETIKEQITAAVDERGQMTDWGTVPLIDWTLDHTLQWLTDIEMESYIKVFEDNDLTGESLLELNEGDLRELGMSAIGHRKKFMRLLAEAKEIAGTEDVDEEEDAEPPAPKEPQHETIRVSGLPESLLEDEDYLFDFEKLVFSGYQLNTFEPKSGGLIVEFDSPVKLSELTDLKEKFMRVLKNLMLDTELSEELTLQFWEGGKPLDVKSNAPSKNAGPSEDERKSREPPAPVGPKLVNYWDEFFDKIVQEGDEEDIWEDEDTKLKVRGAREVLSIIRDCKLKDVDRADPGIEHLKGKTKDDLKDLLSNCEEIVMYQIKGKQPPPAASNPVPKAGPAPADPGGSEEAGRYVGMNVEGLPRFITDDDNTVHGIQSLVFRNVAVRRLIVLDDQDPPALKVEFENFITSEKIPQLARNLKNFLKAVNVDQKALNDVTIAFLEEGSWDQPAENKKPPPKKARGTHKRIETDEFLVSPGDAVEMTRTFMIEGIPQNYILQESFLKDMPDRVFDGVPLEGISVPPAVQNPDGTTGQKNSLEIRFKYPLNIQKLPKIAMKLKKFLKRKQIPPNIVNGVTLQVRHEEAEPQSAAPANDDVSELENNPVVGLIFKGIPKKILESNDSLYDMESDVFTGKHPIRLMEPNETDLMLRITIENPIHKQADLTTIAQRLKRFLARQGVGQQAINDVLVMSFSQEKWQKDARDNGAQQPYQNPSDYVGIEIENMPVSIVDSDKQLEAIERRVFSKQKVLHMNVLDTTLRITFGVPADSQAIEKVARELKRFLSAMKIPIKEINDIIIAPHTEETWDQQNNLSFEENGREDGFSQ